MIALATFTLIVGIVLLGVIGCATIVTPPRDVQDPATVYLVDYGRHSSLVLPHDENSMIEYAFGEWRWFALNDTGLLAACRALCWASTGTLGRRLISTVDSAKFEAWFPGVILFDIQVEREAANAMARLLNDRWLNHEADAVYNADYDFHFVPVPQRYHVFRNCNPVVAGWLRDLDCRVRGPALLSKWRLRPID